MTDAYFVPRGDHDGWEVFEATGHTVSAWGPDLQQGVPSTYDTEDLSPAKLNRLIVRLAADGLWLHESLTAPCRARSVDKSPNTSPQRSLPLTRVVPARAESSAKRTCTSPPIEVESHSADGGRPTVPHGYTP